MYSRFVLDKDTIVYKKVFVPSKRGKYLIGWNNEKVIQAIATLLIPKGAIVYGECYTDNKNEKQSMERHQYRASRAKILKIKTIGGKRKVEQAVSWWDADFIYKIGKTIRPTSGFSRSNEICQSGIHFFYYEWEALMWEA